MKMTPIIGITDASVFSARIPPHHHNPEIWDDSGQVPSDRKFRQGWDAEILYGSVFPPNVATRYHEK